ncbi:MAG: XRE family transcriptional regulator [Bryobacteraceae bacterium]
MRHTLSMETMPSIATVDPIEERMALRLAELRRDRGWSLDELAGRTGISRATLSRIERTELSPTAAILGKLCTAYGWTMSRLVADAERSLPNMVRAGEQLSWTDPGTGYRRRAISPPAPGLRGEMIEIRLDTGMTVEFASSPVAGLEHHLWMLEGVLEIEVEGAPYRLEAGDCLRYLLSGSTRFHCPSQGGARYAIAIVSG